MPSTNAVRHEPKKYKLETYLLPPDKPGNGKERVATRVCSRLHPHKFLGGRRLFCHPWVHLIVDGSPRHAQHSLKAEGVATDELQISLQGLCRVVQVHALSAELGVLVGVIGEAVVRPVEAPKPLGTPEVLLGKPLGKKYMGGCQNYGPLLGPLNTRCRIILGTQKGTIILMLGLMVHTVGAQKPNR